MGGEVGLPSCKLAGPPEELCMNMVFREGDFCTHCETFNACGDLMYGGGSTKCRKMAM